MKIEKDRVVTIKYELRERNPEGQIIEIVKEENPLTFIFGTGRLLQSFENNLLEKKPGDDFSFVLEQKEAYGERREDMVINVPVSVFQTDDGKIDDNICKVGNRVPMMYSEGNQIVGTITEISETYIRMDFNHPMAGFDLCFKGEILEVRHPSDEELAAINNPCSSCSSHKESSCEGSCS